MFIGEYAHSVDAKNRIIIPTKFRDELGSSFIITKGLDHCLFIYPMSEWEKFVSNLDKLPIAKADVRAYTRFFYASANECELDKQGRILIPSVLKEYACLDKDVVITGASTRVEVWSKEKWNEYTASFIEEPEALAEKMVELGM